MMNEATNNGDTPLAIIFGAGHIGRSLSQVLAGTRFRVVLVDERSEWINTENIPSPIVTRCRPWTFVLTEIDWPSELPYVVIVTHSHEQDEAILRAIVGLPTSYIGMIGSKTKWKLFRERLVADGYQQTALDRTHCPVGRHIGGKSPREIAISIAIQLIAEASEKSHSPDVGPNERVQ